jgi:hypothetical protein
MKATTKHTLYFMRGIRQIMPELVNYFFLADKIILKMFNLSEKVFGESVGGQMFELAFKVANLLFGGGELMFPCLQLLLKLAD